jgi:HD-GYP domain-containing protein (c-di-GMP phosphodiesterase class II)
MLTRRGLPRTGALYVALVTTAGLTAVAHSAYRLSHDASPEIFSGWIILAALTLISGSATVRLPSVPATISISEAFVFTSVILFGADSGTLIVALDGLIISCWLARRRREVHRVLFNMAAPALSIWLAASVYLQFEGVAPLFGAREVKLHELIVPIAVFALSHFVLNSALIAVAVAFETRRSPLSIWRGEFLWLSLNYFGGASIAALLAVYTKNVDVGYLGAIVPLLLTLYFTFKVPMARVEDANRHLATVNRLYLSTIETLAMAIDAKDQVTHGHIRRVQTYAVGLAKALGVGDEGLLKAIEASALLHDMGKLAIPEHILNKPGKLTPAEFDKMKLHAAIGADLLCAIEFPYPVVPIVRHHHENWDGTGYPDGLSGTEIPIAARILAVVDCYDALTSDRPYRPALSDETAASILRERRGTMYDPLVVDTFLAVHRGLCPSEPEITTEQRQFIAHIAELNQPAQQLLESGPRPSLRPSHEATSLAFRKGVDQLHEVIALRWGSGCGLTICAYDGEVDALEVVYLSPTLRQTPGIHLAMRIDVGERLTGWVAATNRRILNSDAALDFRKTESGADASYCSAFPIHRAGENLSGVMTLYTAGPIDAALVNYLELVLPRLASELARLTVPDGELRFGIEVPVQNRDRSEVIGLLQAAFGHPPTTFTLRPRNREATELATELLTAVDSPVGLADVLLMNRTEEVLVLSPRREELRAAFAAWARSRDAHRVMSVHVTDASSHRLTA